jgi:hypothetical protein
MASSGARPMIVCDATGGTPRLACRTKPDRVSCVRLGGLLAALFDEDRLEFSDTEHFRPRGDHREVAGRQLIKGQNSSERLRQKEVPKTRIGRR